MSKNKRLQSIILLIVGVLFMFIPNPIFGWGGVLLQIIGIYGLLKIYKPEMGKTKKIIVAVVGGIIFSFVLAIIASFMFY